MCVRVCMHMHVRGCVCVCVCVRERERERAHVCAHVHACMRVSLCIYGGQRTAWAGPHIPPFAWAMELMLRSPGLATNPRPSHLL